MFVERYHSQSLEPFGRSSLYLGAISASYRAVYNGEHMDDEPFDVDLNSTDTMQMTFTIL